MRGDGLAHLFQPLTELAEQIGSVVTVQAVPGEASGFYEPGTRRIVIDVRSDAFSANAQVKTLIHELGRALVRADHDDDDPDLSYADEEVVAESVACCVCASVGIDTSSYSVPYVASWASGPDGAQLIHRYASLIDRIARRLEDTIAAAPSVPLAA